jgi:hypothetical protein
MLAEIETRMNESVEGKSQLELFGALLSDLADAKRDGTKHRVITDEGTSYDGTWEEIVREMRDASSTAQGRSIQEFMLSEARRQYAVTGMLISTTDAESFIRGSADAGLLRIVR